MLNSVRHGALAPVMEAGDSVLLLPRVANHCSLMEIVLCCTVVSCEKFCKIYFLVHVIIHLKL